MNYEVGEFGILNRINAKKGISLLAVLSLVISISTPLVFVPSMASAIAPVSTITITASVSGNTVDVSGETHATSADVASNWYVEVNWGDGSPVTTNIAVTPTSNKDGTWESSHIYVSGGTYTITATFYKRQQNDAPEALASTSASVVIVDSTAPTVMIDSVTPNPTNAGTTITWHTNENGSYAVLIGGADCLTGTSVESGTYSTSPSTVATVIPAANLSEGSNTLRVCVTDTALNVGNATSSITKDTTVPPVITLDGSNPQIVLVGQTYSELGATVTDDFDTGLIATIDASAVNTAVLGSYAVTYNVTDSDGNAATQVTRTVNVVDQEAPVITLLGANPQIIEVHTSYTELDATVADNHDTGLTAVIDASAVNVDVVGSYTVTYNATDSSTNAATQVTRTVNVVDTTAPTIVLTGSADVTLEVDGTYTEAGAIAHDNYDADVAATVTGTVDVNTVGDYTLHYNHTDANGNIAVEVTRTVHVIAHDTTPNQFTFVDQTGVALSTVIESAAIAVTSISAPVAISITGGEYAINGGTFTSTTGTINSNDTVKVHHTSSAANNTTTDTVLTVGSISDTFTSTTLLAGPVDTDGDGVDDSIDNCPSVANANQLNTDGDSMGDACDTDDDNDTILDTADNCPINANTNQANADGDALGDVCDPTPNPAQGGGSGGGGGGGGAVLYTITSSAGSGGSINPLGAISIVGSNNYTVTVVANSGFQIADVLVDGTSVGPVATYTFVSVSASHTISASFGAVAGASTQTPEPTTPAPTQPYTPPPYFAPSIGTGANTGGSTGEVAGSSTIEEETPAGPTTTEEPTITQETDLNQPAALGEADGWGAFLYWFWANLWWLLLLLIILALTYYYYRKMQENQKSIPPQK